MKLRYLSDMKKSEETEALDKSEDKFSKHKEAMIHHAKAVGFWQHGEGSGQDTGEDEEGMAHHGMHASDHHDAMQKIDPKRFKKEKISQVHDDAMDHKEPHGHKFKHGYEDYNDSKWPADNHPNDKLLD